MSLKKFISKTEFNYTTLSGLKFNVKDDQYDEFFEEYNKSNIRDITEKHLDNRCKLIIDIEEYNENIIFFNHLEVDCKSMIDRLIIDNTNKIVKLIDLKTTSNLGEFSHSFEEF